MEPAATDQEALAPAAPAAPGAAAPPPADASAEDAAGAGLSKNARKKLARQATAEQWKERKRQKREAKKAQSAANAERARAATEALSAEEREERRQRAWARREAEVAKAAAWAEDIVTTPFRCVIDLGFEDKMTPRELKSLTQQVMYSYGANRRALTPWKLHLTGLVPGSQTAAQLDKISGFRSWAGVTAHAEDYLELGEALPREKLLYLTADATEEIDRLEEGTVYILGGIVDRNRYPGITQRKAAEQGIRSARLPLAEHVKLLHGTSVLTVNHMVDILLHATKGYERGQGEGWGGPVDWRAALLAALPPRKGASASGGGGGGGAAGKGKARAKGGGGAEACATAGDTGEAAATKSEPDEETAPGQGEEAGLNSSHA